MRTERLCHDHWRGVLRRTDDHDQLDGRRASAGRGRQRRHQSDARWHGDVRLAALRGTLFNGEGSTIPANGSSTTFNVERIDFYKTQLKVTSSGYPTPGYVLVDNLELEH